MVKKETKSNVTKKYGETSEIICFGVILFIFIIVFAVMFWNEGINALFNHFEGFLVFFIFIVFVSVVFYIRYVKHKN